MPQDASRDDTPVDGLIADHTLLRRIGRGSYGDVWLARHTMGMYRAVKIVRRKFFKDHRPFERELSGIRKFEPISRSHEGFIDILHVGVKQTGEYFYYIMELGDDPVGGAQIDPERYSPKTLARELANRGTLDYRAGLQLGLDLSRALAELHRNGLVHRDIKPSNILFVNGVPKLADIGLVSPADEDFSYVGTEGFIPPEGPGTPQADVYALGKVLYEAVTGKDRMDYPELPPDWDRRPDHPHFRELNEVILHACSNDSEQRYRTAEDMHADLVVLLAGKSVRRLKNLERQVSRLKRTGAFCALAAAIAATVFYAIYRERSLALQMRQGQIANLTAYGNTAMDSGDLAGALPYFAQVAQANQGGSVQNRIRLASVIDQCPKIVQMWFSTNQIYGVDLSPDGHRALVVERAGYARVFDVDSSEAVTLPFGESWGLRGGTFSPQGDLVATASEDGLACVYNAANGALMRRLAHPSTKVMSVAFSPDGSRIVTGCKDNLGWVWDLASGVHKMTLVGHTMPLLCATFSHNGKLIATGSRDNTARIWDAHTGRQIGDPLPNLDWVESVAFSPDDTELATACHDRKARIWNVETHEHVLPDLNHEEQLSSVAFSPNGRLIVAGCLDGTARIWLAADHEPFVEAPILRHTGRVMQAVFGHDGHRIITACLDGTVRVWDLAGIEHATELKFARFSEDKARFLTISNGTMQVWDTLSRQPVSPLIRPAGKLIDAVLSADSAFILSWSRPAKAPNERFMMLDAWKARTGDRVGPPLLWTNAVDNLVLSKDGRRLLFFDECSVQTFDLTSGQSLARWFPMPGTNQSTMFNPAGDAVAEWNKQVLSICDAKTGHRLFPPISHTPNIQAVEFSRDGREFATCGADETLSPCFAQVWSAATGEPLSPQLMHGDGVLSSSFSPDSHWLLTGGEDSKAILWQLPGTPRAIIKHKDQVMKVAISPDGTTFLTASADKTTRVWTMDNGNPLTPPLRHHSGVKDARFLAGGMNLVTTDMQNRFWLWKLNQDPKPIQDVFRFSRLLSGESIIPVSTLDLPAREPLSNTWHQLRTRYPSDLAVSDQQVAAWYDFEADESEVEGNLPATIFYLEHLLILRPGDNTISARLTRDKARLQNPN